MLAIKDLRELLVWLDYLEPRAWLETGDSQGYLAPMVTGVHQEIKVQ